MISPNAKKKSVGLFLVATLLIITAIYVLIFNITLIYKGKNSIQKVNDVSFLTEKVDNESRQKSTVKKVAPMAGDEIGQLVIPKLNITVPVFHGTDENELLNGVGHVVGTALPGENSNSVLSGHRDTVFRQLGEVKKGDLLEVVNHQQTFTYKVRKVRIVNADDQTVIVPKRRATLTVSTCYPFSYIGPAKQRYVLIADLVEAKVRRT